MSWGYVVLAPCIVSSVLLNFLWRHRIGYDRPLIRQVQRLDGVSLIEELKSVASAQRDLEEASSGSLSGIVSDPTSITSVIKYMAKNQLFKDFCVRLLQDTELSVTLFGPSNQTVEINSQNLLVADDSSIRRLLEIAQRCVRQMGPRCLKYRERYLLETLGCYLCTSEVRAIFEETSENAVVQVV